MSAFKKIEGGYDLNGVKFYPFTKGYYRGTKNNKGVLLHRELYERYNRPLKNTEIVYHLDGDKENFTASNLAVMSRSEFKKLHPSQKIGSVREKRCQLSKSDKKYIEYLEKEFGFALNTAIRLANVLKAGGHKTVFSSVLETKKRIFGRKKVDRLKKMVDDSD